MSFAYDHDRFVSKNRSLAAAEDIKKKDDAMYKQGYASPKDDRSCFNCKNKQTCSEFKAKRSGRATGVVSFGGDQKFVCERFIPAPSQSKSMSSKQIKSLLKNVKNGH